MLHTLPSLDAYRASAALGVNQTRLDLIHLLVNNPQCSTNDLMMALDLTRNGVLTHLKALESMQLVSEKRETHPRGSGPITYWLADIPEFEYLMGELSRFLSVS
jgi:predicted ArsR family transcriptional regulator